MNPFISFRNNASPRDVWDSWTVRFHSVVLLQTPVYGAALDACLLWRKSPEALRSKIGETIEENAQEAARLIRLERVEEARALLAQNLALVTWLVEDERTTAFEEEAQ